LSWLALPEMEDKGRCESDCRQENRSKRRPEPAQRPQDRTANGSAISQSLNSKRLQPFAQRRRGISLREIAEQAQKRI
jgi:hypothetical protein